MRLRCRSVAFGLAWCGLLAASQSHRDLTCVQRAVLVRREPRVASAAMAWSTASRWIEPAGVDAQRFRDGCGAASLGAVMRDRGRAVPQSLLWSILRQPQGGTTLGALACTARRFGFECEVRWEPCPQFIPTPAILHLRRSHFVVLRAIGPEIAEVLDPACGVVRVRTCALVRQLSGAVLVFAQPKSPAPMEDT